MNIQIDQENQDREFVSNSLMYILDLAETGNISSEFSGESGICDAVLRLLQNSDTNSDSEDIKDIMRVAFSTWPEFSGNLGFPIPSDDKEKSPCDYYMLENNMWQGRQLKKRISLLKHMIEVI